MTVRVDPAALTLLAAELAATAAELARITASAQAIVAHPVLGWAAPRAPIRVARAVAQLEWALLGPRGLVALPGGYAALGVEAARQVAELAVAQAGAAALELADPVVGREPLAGLAVGVGRLASAQWGVADRVAGPLVAAGLRSADLTIGVGRGVLDGWLPEGPGVVREVPAPARSDLGTVAGLYRRIDSLAVGEIEITPVRGTDGVPRYLVLLRGIEPSLNPTVNTPGQAVKSSRRRSDAHSRAVVEALRRAGVPPGSEVMLVGHSQGGITAMNLAAGAGGYRVTHVVAAGSPIGNKRLTSAKVLSIENQGDLVPELDGVQERERPGRTIYRFGADRRLSQAGAKHDLAQGYLPELAAARFGADPQVHAYLASAAPYLLGQPAAPRRFRLESGPYRPPPGLGPGGLAIGPHDSG